MVDKNPLTLELCLLTSFNLRLSIPVIFSLDLLIISESFS